jgi:hypothetical protein
MHAQGNMLNARARGREDKRRTYTRQSRLWLLLVTAALALGWSSPTFAAATVRVLETFPSGERVALGPQQNFSMRLAYASDTPVGIWIQTYYRGERVATGTSPSVRHSGDGDAIAWFFFMRPGDQVDEIRITAGSGAPGSTPVVARHAVNVVAGSEKQPFGAPPAWVNDLGERAKAARQQAFDAQRSQPSSASDTVLFTGFMLAVLALGLGGFAAPVWMLVRWRGLWRGAAATIVAVMAFVVLRIVFDVARDPTSHNLWPFEILMAGALSVVAASVLMLLRRMLIAK